MTFANPTRNPVTRLRATVLRRGAARSVGVTVLCLGLASFLGLMCVYMGDLVAQRPAFFMALPLVSIFSKFARALVEPNHGSS